MNQEETHATKRRKDILGMLPAWLVVAVGGALNIPFIVGSVINWVTAKNDRGDSWEPMRLAYEWYMQPHHGTIYQYFFVQAHIKFQYPPSALLLFVAADALHLHATNGALNLIGWLFVGVEAVALAGIGWMISQKREWAIQGRFRLSLGLFLIAGSCVVFYPVMRGYALGQVQTWLNAWFVIACLCWLGGRRLVAGMLIGAICLFKPQLERVS